MIPQKLIYVLIYKTKNFLNQINYNQLYIIIIILIIILINIIVVCYNMCKHADLREN